MSTFARIDLSAFQANVERLLAIASPSQVYLAVKANGYGHGEREIARAALDAGAHGLAVLEIPAALRLREAGIDAPLFAWLHSPDSDFAGAVAADVDLGVSTLWELDAIRAASAGAAPRIHLKIDTGLHRNGADPRDWPALVTAAVAAERRGEVRIQAAWSHLADASEADDLEALGAFHEAVALAEGLGARFPLLHLAASSAGIRMPEARLSLVRFGIAAYGVSPFDDARASDLGMIPPMRLTTTITATDEEAGTATIGAGFGDGLAAPARHRAEVFVAGRRHRVLEIDADSSTIEHSPGLEVGDEVTVFGPGTDGEPTAEDWAVWASTIGDEILCRISSRVPRVFETA